MTIDQSPDAYLIKIGVYKYVTIKLEEFNDFASTFLKNTDIDVYPLYDIGLGFKLDINNEKQVY